MYIACDQGHNEIVGMLLERQADVNAQTSDGTTALQVAAAKGHEEIVGMLRRSMMLR